MVDSAAVEQQSTCRVTRCDGVCYFLSMLKIFSLLYYYILAVLVKYSYSWSMDYLFIYFCIFLLLFVVFIYLFIFLVKKKESIQRWTSVDVWSFTQL